MLDEFIPKNQWEWDGLSRDILLNMCLVQCQTGIEISLLEKFPQYVG
jgi:hypothetical protein